MERRPPPRRPPALTAARPSRNAAGRDTARRTPPGRRRRRRPPLPVLTEIETKGLVVIDSKPQGATIYLNDKRKGAFGKTPWQGSLESKPVRLILEQKGWKPEERAISPRSDKLIDVYIALSEEHYLGWVEIASNVPGADVFIDRKEIGGHRPHAVHGPPEAGQAHDLRRAFGYDPVAAGHRGAARHGDAAHARHAAVAEGLGGRQRAAACGRPADRRRQVPCAIPCRTEVAPGKHEILVEKDGMEDYEADIDVPRGIETNIDVRMSRAAPAHAGDLRRRSSRPLLIGGGAYVGHLSQQNKDAINSDIRRRAGRQRRPRGSCAARSRRSAPTCCTAWGRSWR